MHEVIVPPHDWFDFAWKVPGCRRITEKLYKEELVLPSLQDAVMDLFIEHDNQGFIMQDQIIRNVPGELFPEVINTNLYRIFLPAMKEELWPEQ